MTLFNTTWFDHDHLNARHCRGALREALTCPGSLTMHLSRHCPEAITLNVLAEQWQTPIADDISGLQVDDHETLFVREIHLACGDQPLVYGRSLFPRSTYARCRPRLRKHGERPLGEWLFSDSRIFRLFTQIGNIRRHSQLYKLALTGFARRPKTLWGRRSVFIIDGHPLLVLEIFLPPLIPCIQSSNKSL